MEMAALSEDFSRRKLPLGRFESLHLKMLSG